MAHRSELLKYMDGLLAAGQFQDYCPNGLQVEGREEVQTVVTGVTASKALIDAAVTLGADLLLVHHGYFWKGEDPRVIGIKGHRIGTLLRNEINLVAYHLPLDAHPELGNNAGLGKALGLQQSARFGNADLGMLAELKSPLTAPKLCEKISGALGREPLWIDGGRPEIKRVAWCTGAAQGYIEDAAAAGAQAFISGEISEYTTHISRELGIHYFAAGHHATERFGARSLGEHIAERFRLHHQFVDISNPV